MGSGLTFGSTAHPRDEISKSMKLPLWQRRVWPPVIAEQESLIDRDSQKLAGIFVFVRRLRSSSGNYRERSLYNIIEVTIARDNLASERADQTFQKRPIDRRGIRHCHDLMDFLLSEAHGRNHHGEMRPGQTVVVRLSALISHL